MRTAAALRCASIALCAAPLLAHAVTVTAVHSFGSTPKDGLVPLGGVTLGADGALYGTTQYGGVYGTDPLTNSGNGTIFRIDADGNYRTIHSFTHLDPSTHGNKDGRWPNSGLLATPDGWIYGVTPYGGQNDGGAVFKWSLAGGFKPLHYFAFSDGDPGGAYPEAALALGSGGRLYGTTFYGGDEPPNDGTVFALSVNGSGFRVLESFGELAQLPASRLLVASNGFLYGIARYYAGYAGGALFAIAPDGSHYTVVHQFDYATEGGFYAGSSMPGLIEGPDGYLYGATDDGGPADAGTLYRVAHDGSQFTVLHQFGIGPSGTRGDGARIHTTPIFGSDGNLYGATSSGGANGTGTLYRMAADGSAFMTLYSFPALPNPSSELTGAQPFGDIAFNAHGQLCGTAYQGGGRRNAGTVFCMTLDAP